MGNLSWNELRSWQMDELIVVLIAVLVVNSGRIVKQGLVKRRKNKRFVQVLDLLLKLDHQWMLLRFVASVGYR